MYFTDHDRRNPPFLSVVTVTAWIRIPVSGLFVNAKAIDEIDTCRLSGIAHPPLNESADSPFFFEVLRSAVYITVNTRALTYYGFGLCRLTNTSSSIFACLSFQFADGSTRRSPSWVRCGWRGRRDDHPVLTIIGRSVFQTPRSPRRTSVSARTHHLPFAAHQ